LVSPREAYKRQIIQDSEEWNARGELWDQDLDKYKQDMNACIAEYEFILGQQLSILQTLGDDERIQPEGYQLYKDFLRYIQNSDDQIKMYEFIEKMRAVLPKEKMEMIEKLHHQLKQNQSKYVSLQKQKAVLNERLIQLGREEDERANRIDRYILSQ